MKITIQYNNKTLDVRLNKSTIVEELYCMTTEEVTPQYKQLKLDIHPKQDIILQSVEVEIPISLDAIRDKIFCNGFQTHSESRLFSFNETLDNLSAWAKPFVGQWAGDYHIDCVSRQRGILHSWSMAYVASSGSSKVNFIGSLNESTGFTLITYDIARQVIRIKKDIENLTLSHSFPALHLLFMQDDTPSVWDTYFKLQEIPKKDFAPISIFSTDENVSETSVLKAIETLKTADAPVDIVHIGRGWQTQLGNVLTPQTAFSKGMEYIAQQIHNQGFKASITIAPFVVEADSIIAKTQPHWLQKSPKGQLLKVGILPNRPFLKPQWLYVLDFYNKEVQEYLTGIFHTILDKWRYDMIKVEYLYAVCVSTRPNKNRGQIMFDALHFLRQLVGQKLLWADAVPLAAAISLADYWSTQTSPLKWNDVWQCRFRNRERATVLNRLKSNLDNAVLAPFVINDASLSFKPSTQNQRMTDNQENTLFILSLLLGNISLHSNILTEQGLKEPYRDKLGQLKSRKVQSIKNDNSEFYIITLDTEGGRYKVLCNLSDTPYNYCGKDLEPFQTLIEPF